MLRILGLAAIAVIASGCASETARSSTMQNLVKDNDNLQAAKEQVASAIQCRYVAQTGSRTRMRICMTKRDWDAHYKKTSQGAREEMDLLSRTAALTNSM